MIVVHIGCLRLYVALYLLSVLPDNSRLPPFVFSRRKLLGRKKIGGNVYGSSTLAHMLSTQDRFSWVLLRS